MPAWLHATLTEAPKTTPTAPTVPVIQAARATLPTAQTARAATPPVHPAAPDRAAAQATILVHPEAQASGVSMMSRANQPSMN